MLNIILYKDKAILNVFDKLLEKEKFVQGQAQRVVQEFLSMTEQPRQISGKIGEALQTLPPLLIRLNRTTEV